MRVYWEHSLRKIPKRLRGTNFCTRSARFAPSFVRQPNSPEYNQIVRNASKRQFTVQWGGSDELLRKIPTRLRGINFCTSSARFAPSFVRQPNGPECTQMVQNAPKSQFRVQWGGVHLLQKIPTRHHGTNFCTSSARFAPNFVGNQTVPNAPK